MDYHSDIMLYHQIYPSLVLARLTNYIHLPLFVAVFKYDPTIHNVVIVDKGAYRSCSTPSGATVLQSGNDRITLAKGQNFFICNFPGHCESGMKIAVSAA